MTSLSGTVQPTLTWENRNIRVVYTSGSLTPNSAPLNNGVYTAVSTIHTFLLLQLPQLLMFHCLIIAVVLDVHVAPFGIPGVETIRIAGTVMLQ